MVSMRLQTLFAALLVLWCSSASQAVELDANHDGKIDDTYIPSTITRDSELSAGLAGKQDALGFTPENAANKGAANGYAGLGSDGKVPSSQLPTLGTAYSLPSLADAQAGASTTPYVWSPQRVAQAIFALAPGSGTVATVTSAPYSDEACTGPKYDTVAHRYYPCVGGYHTAYLAGTAFSNASPSTYTLTIDGTGWDGTDSISVGGSTYTSDGNKTGLSGSTAITVVPNTGRAAACIGTGISGTSSPYSADMSTDREISCYFTAENYVDSFDRANENPLSGSGIWTNPGGNYKNLKIVSNSVTSVAVSGLAHYSIAAHTFSADQYSSLLIVKNDQAFAGPIVRYNTSTKYFYRAYVAYGDAMISRVSGGNSKSWIVASGVSVVGKSLKLSVTGTNPVTLRFYIDGIQVGADVVDNSGYALTSGQPGIGSAATGVVDNWDGGEL